MNQRNRLVLALAAAVLAVPAFAATPINQTRPLAADGRVNISNVSGRIQVRTWDKAEVRITGSLGKGVEKLIIEGDSRSLDIEVKYPQGRGGWGWGDSRRIEPTTLEVMLPRRAEVEIEAVSADVDVDGLRGRRLEVQNVSGDVHVTGSALGEASIQNVSGDLELWLDTDQLTIETVSGDANAHGAITGKVSMDSVSGQLRLSARKLNSLKVGTVSGDADLRLGLVAGGRVDAESLSGNIDLAVPAGTGAQVDLESFSGSIRSAVGHVHDEEHGPGSSLEARMGDGNGRIRLESFSGDLRVQTAGAVSGKAPDVE
ncbi:MAG: DUF4097 family beta strand repeat-containing protein [Arenimonas sp.]